MTRFFAALRNLFRRRHADRDLDAELQNYLAFAVEDHQRRGLSRAEAERAARLDFGGLTQVAEAVRDARSGETLTTLGRDVAYAARVLSRTPGFSVAVILVLALGIGANTAVFSLVNGVLLRPLPVDDAPPLVRVFHVPPPQIFPGVKRFSVSPANYLDWKQRNRVFEDMAAYQIVGGTLTGTSRAEAVSVGRVPPNVFSIVRAQPAMGRAFLPDEDRAGRSQVAIVSSSWWRGHFGDTRLSGQTLTLDHQPYTIVGVMPASFEWPAWGLTAVSIWVPLVWDDAERAVRGNHNYQVVARLKPDVTLPRASAEMDALSGQLAREYPADDTGWGASVVTLRALIVGDVRQSLLVLLGAVGFVLIIASANAANLILGRALGRRKEIAIRTALGASRSRVIRQILVEAVLLSLVAGAVGAALSQASLSLVASFLADQLPRADEVSLDGRVLAFTIAVSLAAGLLAGLIPAVRASRASVHDALKQGTGRTDADGAGRRGRRLLVTAEVALSLILLAGAGLLIRTLWTLSHVDPGFDPRGVLTLRLAIPTAKYTTPAQRSAFFDETLRRARALPGVASAAIIDSLPLSGGSTQPITIDGRAPAARMAEQPEVAVRQAGPDYLKTMRIPLRRGRDLQDRDEHAVLVSESAGKTLWPGEDPLGQRVQFPFSPGASWEVVGIVGDVPPVGLDSTMSKAIVYQWARERPWTNLSIVVRPTADLPDASQAVLGVIHDMDPDLAVSRVMTMEELVIASTSSQRFNAEVLGMFAGIALLLAGIGMYSVLAHLVRSRAREIGIRTALGARRADVVRLVLGEGLLPTAAGLALGLAGAASLGPVLRTLVFGVGTTDPLTLGSVSILMACVAGVATAVPAYRAARLDPLKILRDE